MSKRKIILIIISIAVIAFAFSLINNKEEIVESPINIEVGQEFTGINYSQKKFILNYKISDFNGDATNDVIIFVGEKDRPESENVKNADVVFYDGALKKYIGAEMKKFNGNTARLEIADLTGDSLNDIIITLCDENGYKQIRVVTLNNEELKEIFKAKDNNYINFTGNFIDGIKVTLKNRKLNIDKEVELKDNFNTFIENKVFDNSGKFLEGDKNKIKTTGFIDVEFVQLTGSMGLKTKQRIITNDNKNIIDEITIIWKFEDARWQIKEASGLKLGNLLY